MFEAVYISDSNDTLVYEYLINLSSPSFKSLINIIRTKKKDSESSSTKSKSKSNDANLSFIEVNEDYFVSFERTSSLIIYVLCSSSTSLNPIIPYTFIQRLIEVMSDYFGTPLALTKIDANNDTLTLLINEMIDNRMPNVTDFNKLRDLISFKSLLSKILSTGNDLAAATNKSLSSLGNSQKSSSFEPPASFNNNNNNESSLNSIPWRRSNVRYTNNEMYVDVIERINVILKPTAKLVGQGTNTQSLLSSNSATHFDSAFYSTSSLKSSATQLIPIVGSISGKINFVSHLTGIPLLQLVLSTAGLNLKVPSFHECIKLDKWLGNPGTLSFIPPDGKSTIMKYEIDLESFSDVKSKLSMLGLIEVDFQSGLGPNKNEFEIKLFIKDSKSVSKIEHLVIDIVCQDNESPEANDDESNDGIGRDDYIVNIKTNRVTHGDFSYKSKGKAEWNLRTLSKGIQPFLRGSIITHSIDKSIEAFEESSHKDLQPDLIDVDTNTPLKSIKPLYLKMSYSHKGSLPSGIKVDSLKIVSAKGLGDTVKPYKGVKYTTKTGDFIIRS
ncbi:Mu homology domain-containing protein [Scheffersomyces coipomensis]|uniref:Mu homology domain-containing protein n=1 Tax=Scheffersomyces coipomensis TaxID=1788519 RepID=UPI00315DCC87